MKKTALILALILCVVFAATPKVSAAGYLVVDDAGLFSESQRQELELLAAERTIDISMEIVIVTVNDTGGKTATAYADDHFDNNGHGYGADRDGLLMLIDIGSREIVISTAGIAIRYFTDQRLESMLDNIFNHAQAGDYYNAAIAFLDSALYWHGQGIPDDQFNYDPETGEIDPFIDVPLVVDGAGLFTEEQIVTLQQTAQYVSLYTSIQTVIVTTNDTGGRTATAYADDFFDYNGYGYGADRDGILMLIDMDNREVAISTSGIAIRYFTDARLESMLDTIFVYMPDQNYFNAATVFLDDVEHWYNRGIPEDQYNFQRTITAGEWAFAGFGALAAGLSFFLITRRRYRFGAKKSGFNMLSNTRLNLAAQQDSLVNRTVTHRRIPRNDGGGGGSFGGGGGGGFSGRSTTHTSSSGRTHGGASRKF